MNSKWRAKQREGGSGEKDLLARLREETDRLFDTFLREPLSNWDWPFREGWTPAVDLAEDTEFFYVRAEIPGVVPEDLDLSLSATELVLSGEKRPQMDLASKSFLQTETRYGAFRRAIPLPRGIDLDSASAEHLHGILTVRFRKARITEPKRVQVKVTGEGGAAP